MHKSIAILLLASALAFSLSSCGTAAPTVPVRQPALPLSIGG